MNNKLTAFIGGSTRTFTVKRLKNLVQMSQERRAIRELEMLSDRMLEDIGVRRADIRNRVRGY